MEFLKLITGTAKSLLSSKSLQQILRYIASTTLSYASNVYSIPQYKYDINDNRSMIYHHNMNNDDKINPILSDQAYNIYKIERFMNELGHKMNGEEQLTIDMFLDSLSKITGANKRIEELKYHYKNDPNLLNFDHDTLETSGIIDTNEINSGKIYDPVKDIILLTNEGKFVSDNKNDYLEKRIELGPNPDVERIYKLIQDYHIKNNTKDVDDYFNKLK